MSEKEIAQDLYVGSLADGTRAYLTVRVRQMAGERRTVEHNVVTSGEELSVMTSLTRDGHVVGGGQCVDDVESILADGKVARGADPADLRMIVDAWRRWHLNGTRAGCAHVEPVGADIGAWLDETPPCPVSGYRYGSAWLFEPLPAGLLDDLAAVCERLANR